jgi:hypothetical protein
MPDGRPCLPFYSSAEWLKGVVYRNVPVLRMPARALFEGTPGATLAREFTPDEVAGLLGGGGQASAKALGNPSQIVIGLPEVEPFAYLGWIHYPEAGTPPHLTIGVEGEGDLKEAMFDASAAWNAGDDPDSLVDYLVVTRGSEGVAAWLWHNGRKFYEAQGTTTARRWGWLPSRS